MDLDLDLSRLGDTLVWRVTNRTAGGVWCFVLIPTLIRGRWSFDVDTAWIIPLDEGVLLSKTDAPPPRGFRIDRMPIGAVLLEPGADIDGAITLAGPVRARRPYERELETVTLDRLAFEVGWVPRRHGQEVSPLAWNDRVAAYLRSELEPGGQRTTRSAWFAWDRP
jgi:hypothetical protein